MEVLCLGRKTRSKNGKTLKKFTLVYKNTSSNEFIEYLKPKFQNFVKHNFVVRRQNKNFKSCVKSFSNDCIVFIVDFIHSKFKMKCSQCIGTPPRSLYWFIFHIV
jgi:hypothetical protein